MDNEKKPCCCCGTPAQPEAATAPAIDASAVPTESVTPSCCCLLYTSPSPRDCS